MIVYIYYIYLRRILVTIFVSYRFDLVRICKMLNQSVDQSGFVKHGTVNDYSALPAYYPP